MLPQKTVNEPDVCRNVVQQNSNERVPTAALISKSGILWIIVPVGISVQLLCRMDGSDFSFEFFVADGIDGNDYFLSLIHI